MITLESAVAVGGVVQVHFSGPADGPARFNALWLRDNCRCGSCRSSVTGERLFDVGVMPHRLRAPETALQGNGAQLRLVWADDHESVFAATWLHRRSTALEAADVQDIVEGDPRPAGVDLFDSSFTIPRFDFAAVRDGDAAPWFDAFLRTGVTVVENTPTNKAGLAAIVHRFGQIRATNYGIDWEIDATLEPETLVDSDEALRVHSDLPYRAGPPGIQLLLSAQADVAGGASILTDGYAVAEWIRSHHREAWGILTRQRFPYRYATADHDLRHAAPLVGLDPVGRYDIVRHAPDLVGPIEAPADGLDAVYDMYRLFLRCLADPAMQVSHRLVPGETLVINNHRVLHGRTSFELGSLGRRRLLGCYADLDDLRSAARVANRASSVS